MEIKKDRGTQKEDKLTNLAVTAPLISAIVASVCCIGPVVLAILGIGGAGLFFAKLGGFRPYFIGITALLLGLAFYLTYRKKEVPCKDGACKKNNAGKWSKTALWIVTGLSALLIAFPYVSLSTHNPARTQTGGEIVETIISVEGMTCSGCEVHVERAVKTLDGVVRVNAEQQKSTVNVEFEKGKVTIDDIVEAINKAGYEAKKP